MLFRFIPSTLFTFNISVSTLFMKFHRVDFDDSPDYIQLVFKSAPQRDTNVSRSPATFWFSRVPSAFKAYYDSIYDIMTGFIES